MKSKLLTIFFCFLTFLMTKYCYTNNSTNSNAEPARADCHKRYMLNSQEHWDCRFKTQDWQGNHGDAQSLHFYILMVNGLPENLQEEINKNHYTIADFGCAQGEGTEYFAQIFPNTRVTGVDISSEGVAIAKAKHRKASFIVT